MSESASREALQQEQCGDHAEVLPRGPLARRQLPSGKAALVEMGRRLFAAPPEVVELAEEEEDGADATQERDQAQCAPEVGGAARAVGDQRLVRPVVGVGVVFPGPVGDGGPGGPGKVGGQGLDLGRVLDERRPKARRRGGSAEVLFPLTALDLEGGYLARAEHQGVGRGVVSVLLELGGQTFRREGSRLAADLGEPVEVLRAVVGSKVGAVTPQGPVLHETVLEEDLLAMKDRLPVEKGCPRGVRDAPRNRGRIRVREDRDEGEHGEPRDHHQDGGVPPPGRQASRFRSWLRHGTSWHVMNAQGRPSSTSRTRRRSSSGVNGLLRNLAPGSSTPCLAMASLV